MDINIFIERRKTLKISQVKLCKGICTQSTLSKFENNGRVPSLSILNKLCERLGLSVDDLYKNSEASTTHMRSVLDRIESQLMMENYPDVAKSLDEINVSEINNDILKMQFYYQKGLFTILTTGPIDEAIYCFSQILDNLDEKHERIYTYLAYAGLGIYYSRLNKQDNARFFFTKILDYMDVHKDRTFQKNNINVYLRILTLVYFTAEFYISIGNYDISSEFIRRGIQLCSEQHVTYYLPRLKFLEAKLAIESGKPEAVVEGLLSESSAFAKINNNEVVELRVNVLRNQYRENKK